MWKSVNYKILSYIVQIIQETSSTKNVFMYSSQKESYFVFQYSIELFFSSDFQEYLQLKD